MADEPRHETWLRALAAADQEPPDRRRTKDAAWLQERTPKERETVELVDPVQRNAQADGSDEDEPADALWVPEREVHRHATAERVPDHERTRDREVFRDAGDVSGEAVDGRISRAERRTQRETGQIDDVDGAAKPAEQADLRCEGPPVRREAGKDDAVRRGSRAPGRH